MFSEDGPRGLQASSLDEDGVEKKKSRLGQATVMDSVAVISSNHHLDTFQLLQLQRGIETFTLSSLERPRRRREERANLKLVKLFIVKYSVFIGIAKLEYPAERFFACWFERLPTN